MHRSKVGTYSYTVLIPAPLRCSTVPRAMCIAACKENFCDGCHSGTGRSALLNASPRANCSRADRQIRKFHSTLLETHHAEEHCHSRVRHARITCAGQWPAAYSG